MNFAHDTRVSLETTVDLVNGVAADRLTTPEDLDSFCAKWEFTGSRTHDDAELHEVRRLAVRLRGLWGRDEDGVVEEINDLLEQGRALPRLVRHEGWWDYHLHATSPEQPLATRMAIEFAMAMVDVVRAGELDRLHTCARDDCDGVLVDLSRNRSRRYCSTQCGNLVNVRDMRARR
ncbi:CGNR zinc finger domain-containing protein [Mobilicoccus pelagius]|uniref:Zinc finger CGNR domain-containing protein n=1 Tax=Mobilicoccus pelagius NBRC 104925 TaxID=1089455 RepID=H5UR55_9MICO|nr:CGNR zinc finger domain-containing protein [Mobilicoccus pelagius]GAB48213.1 hypothetical protein MOPEL_067_00620 [Mobilicoccus pelagius NBRC 104925]